MTGTRSSVGPPFFDRLVTPLAILLVLFTGIGPLVAWRRMSREAAWRTFRAPLGVAAAVAIGAVVSPMRAASRGRSPVLVRRVRARRARAGVREGRLRPAGARGGSFPGALVAMVSRNRRRYGGYVVHAGIAVLLVGVAASSTFQTSSDVFLEPGESASVGDYEVRYDEPTQIVSAAEQRLTFGGVLQVTRDGEPFATLRPSRNYYSAATRTPLLPIGGFFEGEATSEVGRTDGLDGDFWTAMQPDLTRLDPVIDQADRNLATDRRAHPRRGAAGRPAAARRAPGRCDPRDPGAVPA